MPSYKVARYRSFQPRTQKSKSVQALANTGCFRVPTIRGIIDSSTTHIDRVAPDLPFPLFARPCPFDGGPKHGYIDSRIVHSGAEVYDLWKQVQADDPQAEILLMDIIPSSYNILLTPSLMVIGLGHDGATAGKDTVSVPLAPSKMLKHLPCAEAGINTKESDPYVEVIMEKVGADFNPYFTQLRAGPKLESGQIQDFIPKEMVVLEILLASTNYRDREWEQKIEAVKDMPGLVVWHPGGALTDHFSIHALTHNIPVIYGPMPRIGSVITPTAPVLEPDPAAVMRGIIGGLRMPLWHGDGSDHRGGLTAAGVAAMLTSLHHSSALTGDHGDLLGVGVGLLMRLGCIGLLGEARHRLPPGAEYYSSKPNRYAVYDKAYTMSPHTLKLKLPWLINVFRYGRFSSASVGGRRWAACGKALLPIFDGVRQLAQEPTSHNVRSLIRAMNIAINQLHNGGWWLNKFAADSLVHSIQEGDPKALVKAAPAFYQARQWIACNAQVIQKDLRKIRRWTPTTLRVPKIKSVQLLVRDGIPTMTFEIKTAFLQGSVEEIKCDMRGLKALMEQSGVSLFMTNTDDHRLKIEGRTQLGATTVLWEEPSLDSIIQASVDEFAGHEEEDDDDDLTEDA